MSNLNFINKLYSFLLLFIINIEFSNLKLNRFDITIDYSKGLENLYINSEDDNDLCKKWIPSLFSPILLSNSKDIKGEEQGKLSVSIPPISLDTKIPVQEYIYSFPFLDHQFEVILANNGYNLLNCYFGLSARLGDFSIDESNILINRLYDENKIDAKIFSFDRWDLKEEEKRIDTNFYYGWEHQDFKSKNENSTLGICSLEEDYMYWGCSFDEMSLGQNNVSLIDKNNKLYKIYFSTENYNITFPKEFSESFFNLTNQECQSLSSSSEHIDYYVSCKSLLNEKKFIPLKLISKNMKITIQIDSQKRFDDNKDANRTYIRYEKVDYFILPLIMFKNFHIQFDAENNMTKFYTEQKDILEVPEEKEDEKPSKEPSNVGKVFLIIFIIILIVAILIGIIWFIRKRKSSVEKNINKYNKFDEDDNYQTLNEQNRVF